MRAQDGKMRLTDVANTEQLLRIIQSIPSKKAEPFKIWLAQVANLFRISQTEEKLRKDRVEEIKNDSRTIMETIRIIRRI